MKARFPHFGAVVGRKPGYQSADRAEPLAGAGRACCCPARPVVTVVMPPASGRPHPVDLLLLCGHHYRVSRAAVTAAGAAVYDELGAPVRAVTNSPAASPPMPRREGEPSARPRVMSPSAMFPAAGPQADDLVMRTGRT
jgi:hypothetical protein